MQYNDPYTDKNFRNLICAIIYEAISDLFSNDKKYRIKAKKFLLSPDCEMYCESIGLNYRLIRNIDFDNPLNSITLVNTKRAKRKNTMMN